MVHTHGSQKGGAYNQKGITTRNSDIVKTNYI